jgi:hypothetical protein
VSTLSPLGMPPAGWPHAGGSLFALYFSKDPTNLSRCAPFKPHLTLTVTFYCLHVFTLVYCCGHVGYMTIMGPSPMATGSGFHPIRIRWPPDPVGHRMKTGWGKADDSADGAPPVNPTAPRGLRPRTPTAVCKRPSAVCFLCGVDGHPIRALMEAPPAVGRKNFRPSPLSPRLCAIVSFAKRSPLRTSPLANIGT